MWQNFAMGDATCRETGRILGIKVGPTSKKPDLALPELGFA